MGADQPDDTAAGAPAGAAVRGQLTWDQGRQAWVPPQGLFPPAPPQLGQPSPALPNASQNQNQPQPQPGGRRRVLAAAAAVVVLVLVAAAVIVGGYRHVSSQNAATTELPATAQPTTQPTSPPPTGSSTGQHEIHYLAGASSTRADIVIRRSNGQLDEQPGLAMPLQSKLGADYLTVHLATGAEAVIRVVTPAATDTVWCSITVDGQTRASTVQTNDHHMTTCSVKITAGVDSDTNA